MTDSSREPQSKLRPQGPVPPIPQRKPTDALKAEAEPEAAAPGPQPKSVFTQSKVVGPQTQSFPQPSVRDGQGVRRQAPTPGSPWPEAPDAGVPGIASDSAAVSAPGVPATPMTSPPPPLVVASPVAELDDLDADDLEEDEPEPPKTLAARLRRISPVYATIAVASIGSALFLLRAMTSHTTPVAVLMSAGVVTALVFALDTVICSAATYAAGRNDESGRALIFAMIGGISAIICALAMAGTLVLVLVLNS